MFSDTGDWGFATAGGGSVIWQTGVSGLTGQNRKNDRDTKASDKDRGQWFVAVREAHP